jgi:hypothetical protein
MQRTHRRIAGKNSETILPSMVLGGTAQKRRPIRKKRTEKE